MRDYNFGNFLRELRVRRGLSQFQLGMLVGVSDKAVSKWENGLARPQSCFLRKLSDALGVTVDEFLACRYRFAENRNTRGVLAMKKKLWEKAGERLARLYGGISGGGVPPMEVTNRYFSEYAELKNTDQIICFEFLSRMAQEAKRSGGHMHINGGVGASFVAYIMGATGINPLRPHYYCPDCRRIQFADGVFCGWDLPAGKCSCGRELMRDGHDLPFETLRPVISQPAHYNISVSGNLYQTAGEIISACFQGDKVVVLTKEKPDIRTYVILDSQFPGVSDGQELSHEENHDRFRQYPAITLVWNKEMDAWSKLEEETGLFFGSIPFTDKRVFDAFLSGDTQGIPEFRTDFFRAMAAEVHPLSVHDLIQLLGLGHGTGVWEGNGQELLKEGCPIGSLIAHWDDIFQYIQRRMKPECASCTGFAWAVMEDVRRGVYARKGMPAEIRQQILAVGVEERIVKSLEKIQYLFPKANSILRVKHAMILIWYKIHCPEAFERILLQGPHAALQRT